MNSLVILIADLKLDEVKVLNALQGEVGFISDLCVTAEDVSPKNCLQSVSWVIAEERKGKERFKK